MSKDFKIILISNETTHKDEAKWVNRLMETELTSFHLRKPEMSIFEMENYLKQINRCFHSKIVLHSNHSLNTEFNLKGLHLGAGMSKKHAKGMISTSFHSVEELKSKEPFEYVFLSPVFNSFSKMGYQSAFNISKLKQPIEDSSQKVIALGGCDETKIPILTKTGFTGMALLGAVWQENDPLQALNKILNNTVRNN